MRGRIPRSVAGLAAVAACVALPDPAAADETVFNVQFVCNDRGARFPLAGLPVDFMRAHDEERDLGYTEIEVLVAERAFTTYTDAEGRASVRVTGDDEQDWFFRLRFDSPEVAMDRPWSVDTGQHQNDVPVQDYGTQELVAEFHYRPSCAIFDALRHAYWNYQDTIGADPPGGRRILAESIWYSGDSWTNGNKISWGYKDAAGPQPGEITAVLREFGESVYHGFTPGIPRTFDSPDQPCRKFEDIPARTSWAGRRVPAVPAEARAFNDGWSEWWAGAWAPAPNCPGLSPRDWTVPGNVASGLAWIDRYCDVDRRGMVGTLERNRNIRSFEEFRSAIGCGPRAPGEFVGSEHATSSASGVTSREHYAGVRSGLRGLKRDRRTLQGALGDSVAEARRAPCPPEPCTASLLRVVRPFLLRTRVEQLRLLHWALAPTASPRSLRRLGARSPVALQRALDRRHRAYQRGTAEFGERQLRLALRAAAPILRRDESEATQAIARVLRADSRAFRAGRLPPGFVLAPGSRLQSAPPLQPSEQPPATPPPETPPPATPPPETPPPGEPPPPGAKPDLMIDSVRGDCTPGFCQRHAVIRNAGSAAAPPSKTAIAGRLQDPYGEEMLVDTPALEPGESATVSTSCTYGTTAFSARADATAVVDESNEGNNDRVHPHDSSTLGCRFP